MHKKQYFIFVSSLFSFYFHSFCLSSDFDFDINGGGLLNVATRCVLLIQEIHVCQMEEEVNFHIVYNILMMLLASYTI